MKLGGVGFAYTKLYEHHTGNCLTTTTLTVSLASGASAWFGGFVNDDVG